MDLFLVCSISGASFLLSFLLFFHPLHQNVKANRWLGFFVFIMACAFAGIYMTNTNNSAGVLFKCLCSVQFLLAPSLFISVSYFVTPTKIFRKKDGLHFIPFVLYAVADNVQGFGKESISTFSLFAITENVSFLVRDLLPFMMLFYLVRCYRTLVRHKANLKLISSDINRIDLDWLVQFLFILSITLFTWMNDAFLELPFITELTPFIYMGSVFFLAYFSIKQKTIFAFKERDIQEIAEVLDVKTVAAPLENLKRKRLNAGQVAVLSAQLTSLMENDKLFLDNALSLPVVAEKLGITIHDASFLINETANDNFYNFINTYRVNEAKVLLASSRMKELNIVGIAFASGFNSKTTFNTTFKRMAGISPSQYSKEHTTRP